MNLHRFCFDQLPVSSWRNGGGETREITSQPPGETLFDWRVSIATIAQDGPFSAFNGIDRIITLLEGDGVHLYSPGQIDHRLQRIGEPFAFSGDCPLEAKLLGGSSHDFNIMTRRGEHSAQVQPMVTTTELAPQHAGVLYILRGEWQLPDGSLLTPRQGCWWLPGDGPQQLTVQKNGSLVLCAKIMACKDNGVQR
ncbi:HutD family protein [Serratia sp. DD3]|uniref:HutD/Ves family protein n=1 Tax=Serratia sp. DD3 TaxID=1410619 RepID=UPI0003C51365|nr:HutD family protein [Serratia sp. DD3]KEY58416.1 HutD [Serratia sp. DD3]